jgi:cell division septation protein DedD
VLATLACIVLIYGLYAIFVLWPGLQGEPVRKRGRSRCRICLVLAGAALFGLITLLGFFGDAPIVKGSLQAASFLPEGLTAAAKPKLPKAKNSGGLPPMAEDGAQPGYASLHPTAPSSLSVPEKENRRARAFPKVKKPKSLKTAKGKPRSIPDKKPAAKMGADQKYFTVVIGKYSRQEAQRQMSQLRRRGLEAFVHPTGQGKNRSYLVCVGKFAQLAEARRLQTELKAQGIKSMKVETWVAAATPPPGRTRSAH